MTPAAHIYNMTDFETQHPRIDDGTFTGKPLHAPCPVLVTDDPADDPEENDVLFVTEYAGVEYDIVDGGDTCIAYGSDGTQYHLRAYASDGHDSIEDAFFEEMNGARLSAATSGLTLAGPTRDIAGYTYQADSYKPDQLVELLITQGHLSPGARGMDPDEALDQLAAVEGVDREDERSFDSDDFPKVILQGQLTADDLDWLER